MRNHDFRFYFNRRRQFCDVYFHHVHQNTFAKKKSGRWGYFVKDWAKPRSGKFGEIHLLRSRLRFDTIVHELDHLRTEWMLSGGTTIVRSNEERMACFLDELVRSFIRELRKIEPKVKL